MNQNILDKLKTESAFFILLQKKMICCFDGMQRDRPCKLMMKYRPTGTRSEGRGQQIANCLIGNTENDEDGIYRSGFFTIHTFFKHGSTQFTLNGITCFWLVLVMQSDVRI
jgi:hypothetical protein